MSLIEPLVDRVLPAHPEKMRIIAAKLSDGSHRATRGAILFAALPGAGKSYEILVMM